MKIRVMTLLLIIFLLFIGGADAKEKLKEALTITTPKEEKALSRGEVESITRKIVDESIKPLAEEKLKIANTTITYASIIIGVVIGLFTLILGFLTYLSVGSLREARKEIDQLRNVRETMIKELHKMKDKFDEIIQIHNELEKVTPEILSRFNTHLGYTYWEINRALLSLGQKNQTLPKQEEQRSQLFDWAIYFTEKAINPPQYEFDKNVRKELGLVASKVNLAYFYAERKEKREAALNYVKEAKDKIPSLTEHEEIKSRFLSGWLTDCAFVKMRFADSLEDINGAIAYLSLLSKIYPQRADEINSHLLEATKIRNEHLSFSAPY